MHARTGGIPHSAACRIMQSSFSAHFLHGGMTYAWQEKKVKKKIQWWQPRNPRPLHAVVSTRLVAVVLAETTPKRAKTLRSHSLSYLWPKHTALPNVTKKGPLFWNRKWLKVWYGHKGGSEAKGQAHRWSKYPLTFFFLFQILQNLHVYKGCLYCCRDGRFELEGD